jgi:hypothetical protein
VKRCKEIVVTKSDGSVECFAATKLAACLARVLAGRAYDPRLSGPLTRAVALHLQDWALTAPPTTQYVFDCVGSVLRQTGLSDVADDLAHHRRLRAARRHRTHVIERVDQPRARRKPWRKLALVATLHERYGLRHAVARFLAGQIESQVFALNYRLVTKSFLAELAHSEVSAWGLADEVASPAGTDACRHPVAPGDAEQEN